MELAPIILFVYNRPDHMIRTISYLKRNKLAKDSVLYIVSDGAKPGQEENVRKVRECAHQVDGFREVIVWERECNYGIEKSEVDAITKVVNKHGKMISLEDDILVNESFLDYMNRALEIYEKEIKVYYITGYNYMRSARKCLPQTFFLTVPSIWGWATWKDRWEQYDGNPQDLEILHRDKEMQRRFNCEEGCRWYKMLKDQQDEQGFLTWDICWYWTVFKHDGLVLYPRESMTINHGLDGSGVHCGVEKRNDDDFTHPIRIDQFEPQISENQKARRIMSRDLKARYNPGLVKRAWMRLEKILML